MLRFLNHRARPSPWLRACGVVAAIALGANVFMAQAMAVGFSDLSDDAAEKWLEAQLGGPAPAALHAEAIGILSQYRGRIDRCSRFFDRFGQQPAVARVLRQADVLPGQSVFVHKAFLRDLERALGGPLTQAGLSQLDLELCLQARDQQVGKLPQAQKPLRRQRISAALRSCVATLRQTGPHPGLMAALRRLPRGVADDSFTSQLTLGKLNRAYGQPIGLSARDLDICVDAYDVAVTFTAGILPGPALSGTGDCQPPSKTCQADLSVICCGKSDVCDQVCDGGEDESCSPVCIPCFPAAATVVTEGGATKAMRDVAIGDRLRVVRPDGALGFEDVYLLTHKDATAATAYVTLTLASGRELTLSPRHFIPTSTGDGGWGQRHIVAAEEVRAGDSVWSGAAGGDPALETVTATRTHVDYGAFNPLTSNGTIVVDGVVASAHSDWFLDGLVSPAAQDVAYQAILAPVRLAYDVLGPEAVRTVAEDWGVVDAVREATLPGGYATTAWVGLGALLLAAAGLLVWRRRRHVAH